VSVGNVGGANGGGCMFVKSTTSGDGSFSWSLRLALRDGELLSELTTNSWGWSSAFGDRSCSDGLLGRGGDSLFSLLSCSAGSTLEVSSKVGVWEGVLLSFCKRSRKASMSSLFSEVGSGAGALLTVISFGRACRPLLRVE
jgi:hypothetical protein